MKLQPRPYQIEMNDATEAAWTREPDPVRVGLVVAATGTGKTVSFCDMTDRAARQGHRVLILVDAIELVNQTVEKLKQMLPHLNVGVDQAEKRPVVNPLFAPDVVVATVQSMRHGFDESDDGGPMRCKRYPPDFFQRIFVDEAHLAIVAGSMAVLGYFLDPKKNPGGRCCGYTATPNRADGRGLGQLFEECVYRFEIVDAIDEGYLVPVKGKIVRVPSVAVSSIKHRDGADFSDDEVAEIMSGQKAILEQTHGLLEVCDDTTIVFCPNVRHAEVLGARLNQAEPDCARWVSAKTKKKERQEIVAAFKRGEFRYLLNCMVLTKGFDCDRIRYVAICRLTKSWSLFTQMVGRGTRPLDGILAGLDDAEDRRHAIADSGKPEMTVVSFVGREGPMNLMGPADALAGSDSDPAITQRAHEIMDDYDDIDPMDALEQAEKEIADERARQQEQAVVEIEGGEIVEEETDLFDKHAFKVALKSGADVAPRHRLAYLEHLGYSKKETASWSGDRVERAIKWSQHREKNGLCSYKQAKKIEQFYPGRFSKAEREAMTKGEAGKLLGEKVKQFRQKARAS